MHKQKAFDLGYVETSATLRNFYDNFFSKLEEPPDADMLPVGSIVQDGDFFFGVHDGMKFVTEALTGMRIQNSNVPYFRPRTISARAVLRTWTRRHGYILLRLQRISQSTRDLLSREKDNEKT